ncbi:MAG: alpha/beta hydrolase [Kordiimonas sp.]
MSKWVAVAVAFLGFNIESRASSDDMSYLQGLNQPHRLEVESSSLGRSFQVFVRTPVTYELGSKKRYPTVYLLDGGHTFPMLASFYQYLAFGAELPDLTIVGISYGTDDWKKGNMRSTDYTAPAFDRDHYGGASAFLKFLSEELLPNIEGRYPIDSSKRIIFGQSLGGQFVLYVAQHKPNLFHGYIASNPALHRNLDLFLKPLAVDETIKPRLFVSSGSNDDARFRDPTLAWMGHWGQLEKRPWDLKMITLPGQTHFSAAPEAFRLGLKWVLVGE